MNTGQLGSQEQRAAATTQQGANQTVAAYNQGVANPTASGMGYTSPFAADAATALAGGGQGALAAFTMGQYGSQLAQGGAGNVLAEAGLSEVASQYGVSAAELQNKEGYDLSNALLGYEGIGLQSQGLAEQASTAAAQQGIEQSQYGVQSGQYPEQMQKAALENANAVRGMRDQAAIGGTLDTTGYQRQQATQGAEYGWQQADIFRNQQLAQLAQQSEQVGYGGQQEQIANQRQQLELAAQGQGLSAQQAQDQLSFGLQQAGVSATGDVLGYLNQAATAQGGMAQTYAAGLSQAAMYGGLGPHFMAGAG